MSTDAVSDVCTNSSVYSNYAGLAYGIGYGVFILFVSIYSWIKVLSQPMFKPLSCCGKLQKWLIELHRKRQCYIALIAHIFDQATDVSVLISWYELSVKEEKGLIICDGINMSYLFYLSVFILILYRTISSIFIFVYTKSIRSAIFQFLDLEIFHAIMINWKLHSKEPSNPQRWIQSWEAAFESAPQSLLQFVFLMKTGSFGNGLIVVSFIFSLFSMISRVITDDIVIFAEEARYAFSSPNDAIDKADTSHKHVIDNRYQSNINVFVNEKQETISTINVDMANNDISHNNIFNKNNYNHDEYNKSICWKWIPHPGYTTRIIWRFMDISLRVMTCTLLWVIIGGFFLMAFLMFEFFILLFVSIKLKAYDILHGMIAVPICRINKSTKFFSELFFWYRSIGHFLILIIVTAFVLIDDIKCIFCVNYEERLTWSISNNLMTFVFTYCWLISFIYPILWIYISLIKKWIRFEGSKGRTVEDMYASEDLEGLIEMMEFGYITNKKTIKIKRKKFKKKKINKEIGRKQYNLNSYDMKYEEDEYDDDNDEIGNALLLEDLASCKDWRQMNSHLILAMIELKVDFNNIRNKYNNILHQLCQRTDDISYAVRKILQNSITMDINEQEGDKEMTALHFACLHGKNINIINVLCTYPQLKTLENYKRRRRSDKPEGVDVNIGDYKNRTSLHIACQYNTIECVRTLLNVKGCDVYCKDVEGNNILHYAARGDNYDVLKFIFNNDILEELDDNDETNNNGISSSHYISQYGTKVSMELFIKYGFKFNKYDFHNNGSIFYSLKNGNLITFKILLSLNLSNSNLIGKIRNKKERTALHEICRCRNINNWNNCYLILEQLIDDFLLDPNIKDISGSTPLHYAIQYSSAKIVKFLIGNDADINIMDNNNKKPVDILRERRINNDKNQIQQIFDNIYNKNNGNVENAKLLKQVKGPQIQQKLKQIKTVKNIFRHNKGVVIQMNQSYDDNHDDQ